MSKLSWRIAIRLSVLCLVTAAPAAADQAGATGPTVTPSGSYLNLQPKRRPDARPLLWAPVRPTPAAARAPVPRVICGMTMIPGDNTVDDRMVVAVPKDAPRPTLRAVDPPLCSEGMAAKWQQ